MPKSGKVRKERRRAREWAAEAEQSRVETGPATRADWWGVGLRKARWMAVQEIRMLKRFMKDAQDDTR